MPTLEVPGVVADDDGVNEGDEGDLESDAQNLDTGVVDEGDEGGEEDEGEGDENERDGGQGIEAQTSNGNTEQLKKKKKAQKNLLMSPTELKEFKDAVEQTGIVFISRIPPFMGVTQLRQLLSPYGEIGRIYLTPEDKSAAKKRQKGGGTSRKKFVDGWVEFMRKKIAKRVCRSLNGTPIGGSHRSKFASDLWTLKYLRGFKWNHLTEKITYERANRENKIQTELSQAKKQVKWALNQAEKAKVFNRIENSSRKKRKVGDEEYSRSFKQRELRTFD